MIVQRQNFCHFYPSTGEPCEKERSEIRLWAIFFVLVLHAVVDGKFPSDYFRTENGIILSEAVGYEPEYVERMINEGRVRKFACFGKRILKKKVRWSIPDMRVSVLTHVRSGRRKSD
jgi:hypothetical protein